MIYLSDRDNGCYYVSKAGELGIEEAYSVLKRYCNKQSGPVLLKQKTFFIYTKFNK